MNKQHILDEIRRVAADNGGSAPGIGAFYRATGIKHSDWRGKIWARWGDALREAGFEPNQLQTAYNEDVLIEKFIVFVRELGRFPVKDEIKMRARNDSTFPWHSTFARFGRKQQFASKIITYCESRSGYEDVIAICQSIAQAAKALESDKSDAISLIDKSSTTKEGYVYLALLKLGREKVYKICSTVFVERRTDQISIQLPEDLELVHKISTDDAYGIEHYWHRRFAAKKRKGEWFSLSRHDIEAFKRRKFM